jgi:glycerate kinase
MPLRVLIAPDKFKGTLSATAAARAMAHGWHRARPEDELTLLPLCDGGEGFGELLAARLKARQRTVRTVDAARRPLRATWWWEPRSRTAILESARVIGLARLPRGEFHPRALDTFGLGAVLQAAAKLKARRVIIGLGGSATNDGGFGVARSLGWRFLDQKGMELTNWLRLVELRKILQPAERLPFREIILGMDVQNRLLGPKGCTRIFGPQKGLSAGDFPASEKALAQLARQVRQCLHRDVAHQPGAGAAGGLGFGLMAFAGATAESGFELFARQAGLRTQVRLADVVVTGEGRLDRSTLMGKGVGELARSARRAGKPCLGIGGAVEDLPQLLRRFAGTLALTDLATPAEAIRRPSFWLSRTAAAMARDLPIHCKSGLRCAELRE